MYFVSEIFINATLFLTKMVVVIDREARQLHSAGLEAFKREDFKGAEQYFSRATELAPHNPNCWAMLGNTLYFQNRKLEALRAYMAELQLRPNGAAAYADIAIILGDDGKLDEALEYAKKSVDLVGGSIDVLFNMGRLATESKIEDIKHEVEKELLSRNPFLKYTDIFVSGFAPWAVTHANYSNKGL